MLVATAILLVAVYIYLGFKEPAVALVTSPFVAGALFVVALSEDSAAMVIAPFIFFVTLIAVLLSKRKTGPQQWPQRSAKFILICLVILTPLVLVALSLDITLERPYLWLFFGPDLLWLNIISFGLMALAVAIVGAAVSYGLASRHAVAAHVLSTIGSSMRQNLPLPMALESAASGRKDIRSRILNAIQKWLVQGYSLSESIRRGYPACPGHALAMIAAAERIDQLPFAIKAIEADMVARADERRRIRPVHPFYPAILLFLMFFIVLWLMTSVIPSFKTAIIEMDAGPLPASTRFLLEICGFFLVENRWLVGLATVLMVLVAARYSIYVRFRPRRPRKPYLLSRIADFVKWHLPILHSFEKNYSMIQVVELLRLSLNAGCTVNDAIDNTISLDVNNCFKKRLRGCLERVERGDNIAAAINESKLGSTLAWAFDEKVNKGNTLSILETLESFYRSNYNYCVNLARFIIWPCVMLVIGAIVGFVVYAIFSPGIQIIKNLTEMVTP